MSQPPAEEHDDLPPLVGIGDIHGRADLLNKLLVRLEKYFAGRPHQTVFLGDYVDRGRDSAEVLNMLLAYQDRYPHTVFLKGNHEQAMLDFLAAPDESAVWLEWGGEETLASYNVMARPGMTLDDIQMAFAEALPDSHFHFLMNLHNMYEVGPYVFVHAGIDPHRPLTDQSETDLLWIREAFLDAEPSLFQGRTIIHGHTPVKTPDNFSWRINVDTGAFWSSKLTAVVLEQGERHFIST